jgi:hypothetical protein
MALHRKCPGANRIVDHKGQSISVQSSLRQESDGIGVGEPFEVSGTPWLLPSVVRSLPASTELQSEGQGKKEEYLSRAGEERWKAMHASCNLEYVHIHKVQKFLLHKWKYR